MLTTRDGRIWLFNQARKLDGVAGGLVCLALAVTALRSNLAGPAEIGLAIGCLIVGVAFVAEWVPTPGIFSNFRYALIWPGDTVMFQTSIAGQKQHWSRTGTVVSIDRSAKAIMSLQRLDNVLTAEIDVAGVRHKVPLKALRIRSGQSF